MLPVMARRRHVMVLQKKSNQFLMLRLLKTVGLRFMESSGGQSEVCKHSRASIFNACQGIVRHDMQTSMYLLPYLVLNAVCHGTEEARHGITEEIQSVLNATASENSGAVVYRISGGQSEVCIQAVFTLLDNLGQWVDDVKQELAFSQSFQSPAWRQQASKSKSKDQSSALSSSQEQLVVQCSGEEGPVAEKIARSKQALIAPLAAAGMDSYTQAYPIIVKLHLLRELEDFHTLLDDESFLEKSFQLGDCGFSKVVENWENRLRITQPLLWAREPLLAFRRLVFGASSLGGQVRNCWLQYAKLCRLTGHYEIDNRAIREAQTSGTPNFTWKRLNFFGILGALIVPLLSCSSLFLTCQWRWIHYIGQKQKEDVISLYSRVRELQPKWEKGYFYMAKYCDEVLVDARKRKEVNFELRSRIVPLASAIAASSNSKH
ncbi:hypothetical protein PTKIN_Ptkin11bG0029400 [Pterospermum kingtungense]